MDQGWLDDNLTIINLGRLNLFQNLELSGMSVEFNESKTLATALVTRDNFSRLDLVFSKESSKIFTGDLEWEVRDKDGGFRVLGIFSDNLLGATRTTLGLGGLGGRGSGFWGSLYGSWRSICGSLGCARLE